MGPNNKKEPKMKEVYQGVRFLVNHESDATQTDRKSVWGKSTKNLFEIVTVKTKPA